MNESEDKKTRGQEDKLLKFSPRPTGHKSSQKFCHPELCKANRRGTSLVSLHPYGDSVS